MIGIKDVATDAASIECYSPVVATVRVGTSSMIGVINTKMPYNGAESTSTVFAENQAFGAGFCYLIRNSLQAEQEAEAPRSRSNCAILVH